MLGSEVPMLRPPVATGVEEHDDESIGRSSAGKAVLSEGGTRIKETG